MTPDQPEGHPAPDACRPCRGTGTIVSNRGEEPNEVRCPWCQGTGRQIPGHDAQSAPAER